jgi:hypothetical protein
MSFNISRVNSFIKPLAREAAKSFNSTWEARSGSLISDKILQLVAQNDNTQKPSKEDLLSLSLNFSSAIFRSGSALKTAANFTKTALKTSSILGVTTLGALVLSCASKTGRENARMLDWAHMLDKVNYAREANLYGIGEIIILDTSFPNSTFHSAFDSLVRPLCFSIPKTFSEYSLQAIDLAKGAYDDNRLSYLKEIKATVSSSISNGILPTLFREKFDGRASSLQRVSFGSKSLDMKELSIQGCFNATMRVSSFAITAFYEYSKFQEELGNGKGNQTTIIAKYLTKTILNLAQEHFTAKAQDFIQESLVKKIKYLEREKIQEIHSPRRKPRSLSKKQKKIITEINNSILGIALKALIQGSINHARKSSGLEEYLN